MIGPTFPKICSEKHYMDKKFPLAQNTLSHAKTIRKSELKCHRKSSQSNPCDYQRGTIIKVFLKTKTENSPHPKETIYVPIGSQHCLLLLVWKWKGSKRAIQYGLYSLYMLSPLKRYSFYLRNKATVYLLSRNEVCVKWVTWKAQLQYVRETILIKLVLVNNVLCLTS